MARIRKWYSIPPQQVTYGGDGHAPLALWDFELPAGSTLLRTLASADLYHHGDSTGFPGPYYADQYTCLWQRTGPDTPDPVPPGALNGDMDLLHYDLVEWVADFTNTEPTGGVQTFHAAVRVDTPAQRRLLGGGSLCTWVAQAEVRPNQPIPTFARIVVGTVLVRQLWEVETPAPPNPYADLLPQ